MYKCVYEWFSHIIQESVMKNVLLIFTLCMLVSLLWLGCVLYSSGGTN